MARGALRHRLTVIAIRVWGTYVFFVSREPNRKPISRKLKRLSFDQVHVSFKLTNALLHKNAFPKQMIDRFDFCLTKSTRLAIFLPYLKRNLLLQCDG